MHPTSRFMKEALSFERRPPLSSSQYSSPHSIDIEQFNKWIHPFKAKCESPGFINVEFFVEKDLKNFAMQLNNVEIHINEQLSSLPTLDIFDFDSIRESALDEDRNPSTALSKQIDWIEQKQCYTREKETRVTEMLSFIKAYKTYYCYLASCAPSVFIKADIVFGIGRMHAAENLCQAYKEAFEKYRVIQSHPWDYSRAF